MNLLNQIYNRVKKFYLSFLVKLIFITIFWSCNVDTFNNKSEVQRTKTKPTQKGYTKSILIPFDEMIDSLYLTQIVESIDYITLEDRENNLIGWIDKIMIKDSFIYIIDEKKSTSVFCFKKNGDFKFRIDKYGRGPGEYSYIEDVTVDNNTNNIFLYDRLLKKIIRYDNDGQFIDEINIPFYARGIESLEDGRLAFNTGEPNNKYRSSMIDHNLVLTNSKGEIQSYHLPTKYKTEDIPFLLTSFFSKFRDSLSFVCFSRDTVFNFDDSKNILQPKYAVDYGEYRYRLDHTIQTRKDWNQFYDSNKAFGINNFYESDKFIIFNFFWGKQFPWVLYSKISGKIICAKKVIEPIEDRYQFWGPFVVEGDYLYSVLYPQVLKKENIIPEQLDNIDQLLNPILIKMKLKKF